MPTVGDTKFNWAQGENGRLSENWSPGRAEVLADINIRSATQGNRYQAARDLLGFNTLATTAIDGQTWTYVTRALPYAYPAPALGASSLYAASLAGGYPLGVGRYSITGSTGVNDYNQYRYTMGFSPREYQVKSDGEISGTLHNSPIAGFPDEGDALRRGWINTRFITRRFEETASLVTVPQGMLQYQSDHKPLRDLAWPYSEAGALVTYIWHLVPLFVKQRDAPVLTGVPFNTIGNILGKVNASNNAAEGDNLLNFDIFPPGTLLFTSMEYDVEPGPLGDLLATVRYRFLYRPRRSLTGSYTGHNGALKINADGKLDYVLVVSAGNGTTLPFPSAQFAALFRPDPPA